MKQANEDAVRRIQKQVLEGTPVDIVERYAGLEDLAEHSDFGALDSNIVVVDTETTGVSFHHDELTQIAAARMEHGEIVDWFVTFVNPGKPIPEDIVHLTGIHDSDVETAPTPGEACAALAEFAGDAKMIAHNAAFDRTFLTRHPEGYPLIENLWLDSLDLSRIALARLKSHRLIDLVKTFDTPVSTHRADADVAATCAVFRILLAGVASMPSSLVEEIAQMASVADWNTIAVFRYFAAASREKGFIVNDEGGIVVDSNLAFGDEENPHRFAFSLRKMRAARIHALPKRRAKRDAEQIAGDPEDAMVYPTEEDVDTAFSEDGLLGTIYDSYECRAEQLEMAQAIRSAFERSDNLVVEAGTGVGKSMAYLVPAVLLAKQNNVAVGVATKTNALLDQLVYTELPALSRAYAHAHPEDGDLTFAPLKGYAHYICLRKVNRIIENLPLKREVAGQEMPCAPAAAGLLSYIEQTDYDDMDRMKIDYRLLPRYTISTTSNDCLHRKCPFYHGLCYTHGARARAESADIIVTNQTLLFCDLAAEGGLLPTARHWIIDEAHDAEPEARSAFTHEVGAEKLLRAASRVSGESARDNVYLHAERAVTNGSEEQITLFYALEGKAKKTGEDFARAARTFAPRIKDLLYYDESKRSRRYDHVDLWINDGVRAGQRFGDLRVLAHDVVEASDVLVKANRDLVAYLDGVEEAAVPEREISSLTIDVRNMRNDLELIFETVPDNYVYAASLDRKKDRYLDALMAQPLDVGQKMNETLYPRTHSVIYASATLAIDGSFDAFEQAMGLNESEESHADALCLDSSFDYDNNMIVYVVKDMPEPNDPKYLAALEHLLIETHVAQRGSMLTLFTNRREMETCFDAVRPVLQRNDLRLVCQKWGVSPKGLRDEFLADESLSLFALKSFWQGFDAPGSTLRGVIIPKLPFARPSDPLYCERQNRDDRAWFRYVLPKAVIETKQAAGRLIRKADDTGVLILADKRLLTKGYGKAFLHSLQSKTVRVCTVEEIATSLAAISAH